MKIKFGAIVVDGRGKIGGHVASKNKAGAYLRTKVTPVNPNTAAQAEARNRLTTLSQSWKDIPDGVRTAWNEAVGSFSKTDIFGDIKNPSGFNLYQRLNNNLVNAGLATILVPPVPAGVLTATLTSVTFGFGPTAASLVLSGNVPAGTSMIVMATGPLSAGISFVKSEYRQILVAAAATPTPLDILAAYSAKFPIFQSGQKIFVKIKFINEATGQSSGEQSGSSIVA